MPKPNLLFVEDNLYFRKSTIALLQSYSLFNKIWEAEAKLEAIDLLKNHPIDIILLDVRLRQSNGLEVADYVHKHKLAIPIIVITAYVDKVNIMHIVNSKVNSILLKPSLEPLELKKAITSVLSGDTYCGPRVKYLVAEYGMTKKLPTLKLTEGEKKLLDCINEGLTSKEISNRLDITPASVDTYRKRLIQKTQTKNVQELISFAYRNGLLI